MTDYVEEYPDRFKELISKLELDAITANDLFTMLSTCDIVLVAVIS
jgi:hypothetical protein